MAKKKERNAKSARAVVTSNFNALESLGTLCALVYPSTTSIHTVVLRILLCRVF